MSFTSSLEEVVAENANKLLGVQSHWRRIKLREVCSILNGYPFESSRFSKERGIPLLRIRDILPGTTETFYEGAFDPTFVVQPGELVVGMDGDFNCEFWRGKPALLNQRVCKLTTDETRYSKRFLRHVLPGYLSAINAHTHSVTVKHLSSKTVGDIPLPFPPLDEQRRIVAELETQLTRFDASVTALKRVQANLKRYRASVLKAACEGRLVPTEADLARPEKRTFDPASELLARAAVERRERWNGRGKFNEPAQPNTTDLAVLPDGWAWCTWESVLAIEEGAFKRGPFGSALKKSIFVERGYKVYEQYCPINDDCSFGRYYITPNKFEELKSFEVKARDFLISCSGVTLGRITQVPKDYERGIINQALLRVRLNNGVIHDRYFLRLFRASFFQRLIFDNSTGSAIPNVKGAKELKAIPIPLPPIAEQLRIVSEVERRLSVIEELEATVAANLKRAGRLRQSILQRAFTADSVVAPLLPKQKPAEAEAVAPAKKPNRHFARSLLSAEIVHQLHGEPTFGRVKYQKIFHLCEHIARLAEIQGQYHREAAGPLDNKLIYANEAELKKQQWYEAVPRDDYGHAYREMSKAGGHGKYLEHYWSGQLEIVRKLIELMRTWDTERCEIFSTAYAAWNDLLLWSREATEDAIVHEILNRWHDKKRRIPEERWRKAIQWIKRKGYVPTGFGQPTCLPANLAG